MDKVGGTDYLISRFHESKPNHMKNPLAVALFCYPQRRNPDFRRHIGGMQSFYPWDSVSSCQLRHIIPEPPSRI
ncbi:hypothetical protein J6590_026424 [Homalodisca vitripennis]|nr:hypothetical protein J6590_026424 [Homalodisca vitripennis]